MVWADARDVLDTVSKWQSYVDLVQILGERGMFQAVFNVNTQGPDDERFTTGVRDLVLQHAPSASFGPLMAILALYAGCHINEVTRMVASLGEVESRCSRKEFRWCLEPPLSLRQKANPGG